jgi:L-lactate dehydrogenase complex protein LldG
MSSRKQVLKKVRQALGRSESISEVPAPPSIDEPIVRLVHSDIGLPELYARQAAENRIDIELLYVDELLPKLVEFLRLNECQRVAISISPLLESLQVPQAISDAGIELLRWDQMPRDTVYDCDCGLTDVYCAVAETGSLVIRASEGHGRSLSLVPRIHVAIVEPKNFVADLVDLFEKISREGTASGTVLISGPSKTSDIEMNLVIGVHGPMKVKVFVLQ